MCRGPNTFVHTVYVLLHYVGAECRPDGKANSQDQIGIMQRLASSVLPTFVDCTMILLNLACWHAKLV